MFGKKSQPKAQATQKISANVTTIPKEFYGGANPVVFSSEHVPSRAAQVEKPQVNSLPSEGTSPPPPRHMAMDLEDARKVVQETAAKPSAENKKHLPDNAVVSAQKKVSAAPKTSKNKTLLIVSIVFVILAALGGSWYVVGRNSSPELPVATTPPPVTVPTTPVPEVVPDPVPVITTEPENVDIEPPVPTSTPSLQPMPLRFPRVLLADASDLDEDSLTDEEELIFGTDVGIWDTDQDGYYDGQEVVNLYNPGGFAPVRLIDSGFVRDYVHPEWQYHVYYPVTWDVAPIDEEERQILFSAITGDFIEIRVMDRLPGESFEEWFGREAIDQFYTDLQPVENRFQEQGMRRNDDLVAYFATETQVFVLIYNPGVTGTVPYRHIMQMMYQSFRPGRNIVPLPRQRIIPPVSITAPTSSEEDVISLVDDTETSTQRVDTQEQSTTEDAETDI